MENIKLISALRQLLSAAILLLMTACREDDQVFLATCDPKQALPLAFIVPPLAPQQQVLLNRRQLALGTVLQLDSTAASKELGSYRVIHAVAPTPDSYNRDRIETLAATIPGKAFSFRPPKGVGVPATPQNVMIYFEESRRTTLRDPIASLNKDERAVELLRGGSAHSRYVIVSAVWFGSTIDIWSSAFPFVGVNVSKQGSSYLHAKFYCPPLTGAHSDNASSTHDERLILFAYTQVKYDPGIRMIVEDDGPLDLHMIEPVN